LALNNKHSQKNDFIALILAASNLLSNIPFC